MLGDAKTISDEDNERGSQSFDAPGDWTTPSSPAGLGREIAPSWDTSWTAETAAPIEPDGWATAEFVTDSATQDEPRGFAGWGGLANTDPDPISHDLSAWDSPTDAVVAEVADAPWGFHATTEAPVWAVGPDVEAPPSAWDALPDPPSSSAAAWDPAPLPPNESEEPAADWSDEAAASVGTVAFSSPAAAAPETAEPALSTVPTFEAPAEIDQASSPALIEHSETDLVDEEPTTSETASPEPYSEFTEADPAPLLEPVRKMHAPMPVVSTANEVPAAISTPKRRGRLAARSANRSVAVEPEPGTSLAVAHDDVPEPVAVAEMSQPPSVEPALQPEDTAPGADVSLATTALATSIEPLGVDEIVAIEGPSGAGRSFFAKRDPDETAMSSRESPRVLRIAAVASLLIGLCLFGYSVVASRSSDSNPAVVTTPAAAAPPTVAPTVPTASVAEATERAPDPIFGSNDAVGSPIDFAGTPVDVDPIFGSELTGGSPTVSTGATVVVESGSDPTGGPQTVSTGATVVVDPVFDSSPAAATKVEE